MGVVALINPPGSPTPRLRTVLGSGLAPGAPRMSRQRLAERRRLPEPRPARGLEGPLQPVDAALQASILACELRLVSL